MKDKRKKNQRLTSNRERRKQYFVHGVVKRGTNETWIAFRLWVGRLVKTLVLAALVGGTCYGARLGWKKLFWQNPDYALSDIPYLTDGSLTCEQACAVAKLRKGVNIFSYDTNAVRDSLRALPQVESVEVVRYLPNRIGITVKERKPAAWLTAAPVEKGAKVEAVHLLDANGIVFKPRHVPYEFKELPTIAGVQTEDLEPGKPIHKAEVRAALELLNRTRETGAFKVTSIDVSKGCYLVATDQKRAQLTFGLEDIAGQLERFSIVRDEVTHFGQDIQTINLIPKTNIPVTFMQPAPAENDDVPAPAPAASVRAIPVKAKTGGDAPASAKDKAKPANKSKEPPKKEGNGLLKHFRTA